MTGVLPTVILGHPEQSFRCGLHAVLTRAGYRVRAEAATARGVHVGVASRPSDALVIGVGCPGDVIGAIRCARRNAVAEVVVVADAIDGAGVVDMVEAGATGFVVGRDCEQVAVALDKVLSGGAAVPEGMVRELLEECRRRADAATGVPPWSRLTPRQRQVLELLRRGLDTHQIADLLVLEPVTVRSHIAAALHELRVGSRDEAVEMLRHGPAWSDERDAPVAPVPAGR